MYAAQQLNFLFPAGTGTELLMKITTKISFDRNGRVLEHDWFEYTGPVADCCGAPSGQTALANAQTAYYSTLTANANAEFADASGVFSQLSAEYSPIFAKGPSQYGYSTAETNALNSEAATGVAENYNSVNQAVKESLATEGGGNTALPSGVNLKAAQSTATAGAQQLSQEQNQIQQAGFQQGYDQWLAAAQGLGQAESVFGTANQGGSVAVGAGSAANQTYSAIASENESPLNAVIGGLSGAAGAVINQNPGNIFG
jgi:hypothetical protein